MNRKERETAPNEYKKIYDEFVVKNLPIPAMYEPVIDGLMAGSIGEKLGIEGYELAKSGDFSKFEQVDPVLRNWLASKYENAPEFQTLRETLSAGPSPETTKILKDNTKNPAFRLYCSLKSRQDPKYREYDDMMIDMLMEDTMRPLTSSQIRNVHALAESPEHAQQMIEQNVEKQVQMAKMMFVAHAGQTKLVNDANETVPMNRSVASMMAHCSRTAFVFSKGDEKEVNRMMGNLTGAKMGKGAGVYGRFAATHSTAHGKTIGEFKEKKSVSLRHQYGMDVAIGGLGNDGIPGRKGVPQILNTDGTCGHMYMRVDKGGADKTSSLLIGFESDAPGKGNQQGHGHTSAATGEFMSSFLGQREDEMGAKYGGRIVDCTIFKPEELSMVLEKFTSHYRAMVYESMKDPNARVRLEEANKMLSGKLMSPLQLETCLNKAGMDMGDAQIAAQIVANKKDLDHEYEADRTKVGEKGIRPMEAPEKPSKRVRLKAFFGNKFANKVVKDYKEAKVDRKEAAKKVAMSFSEFSKEASKDKTKSKVTPKPPEKKAPTAEPKKKSWFGKK